MEILVKKMTCVCALQKNFLPKSPINRQHLGIPGRAEDIPVHPQSYPQLVENLTKGVVTFPLISGLHREARDKKIS